MGDKRAASNTFPTSAKELNLRKSVFLTCVDDEEFNSDTTHDIGAHDTNHGGFSPCSSSLSVTSSSISSEEDVKLTEAEEVIISLLLGPKTEGQDPTDVARAHSSFESSTEDDQRFWGGAPPIADEFFGDEDLRKENAALDLRLRSLGLLGMIYEDKVDEKEGEEINKEISGSLKEERDEEIKDGHTAGGENKVTAISIPPRRTDVVRAISRERAEANSVRRIDVALNTLRSTSVTIATDAELMEAISEAMVDVLGGRGGSTACNNPFAFPRAGEEEVEVLLRGLIQNHGMPTAGTAEFGGAEEEVQRGRGMPILETLPSLAEDEKLYCAVCEDDPERLIGKVYQSNQHITQFDSEEFSKRVFNLEGDLHRQTEVKDCEEYSPGCQ